MDSAQVYECNNQACTLGSRKQPGLFTGGISKEQAIVLNGDPKAPYGEGICTNCGEKGDPTGEEFTPAEGEDPNQELHEQVHARVMDPNDPLTQEDAQDELRELAGDFDEHDEDEEDAVVVGEDES